jgi:hypothetical protein
MELTRIKPSLSLSPNQQTTLTFYLSHKLDPLISVRNWYKFQTIEISEHLLHIIIIMSKTIAQFTFLVFTFFFFGLSSLVNAERMEYYLKEGSYLGMKQLSDSSYEAALVPATDPTIDWTRNQTVWLNKHIHSSTDPPGPACLSALTGEPAVNLRYDTACTTPVRGVTFVLDQSTFASTLNTVAGTKIYSLKNSVLDYCVCLGTGSSDEVAFLLCPPCGTIDPRCAWRLHS